MGFLDDLWDAVKSGADKMWEMRDVIKEVVSAIDSLFSFSDKVSKEVSKHERYVRELASAAQTAKINNALADFKNESRDQANNLEIQLSKVAEKMFESLLDSVEKINNKKFGGMPLHLPVREIKSTNRKSMRSIRGTLIRELTPKISIDNKECLEILEQDSGEEKKKAMKRFIDTNLKQSIATLQDNIKENAKDCVENIKDKLESRLQDIQRIIARELEYLADLKATEGKDVTKKEQKQLVILQELWFMEYAKAQAKQNRI
ncbi:hypothetical protein [Helicobacter labetoulli]|uniref:hypothetical protein n=1 Tax=Helicobacter labetoulli TaxID=2315333 RepID=UPI000EF69C06|nr:hypothetical protein [Helicobacter labetoulli]